MSREKIIVTGGSGFIGTNYINYLIERGDVSFINIDINPPLNSKHKNFWKKCDLLDFPMLKKIIREFSPDYVVHLAAKTGTNEKKLSTFAANIDGVENLIRSLRDIPNLKRVVFTSSLLVCKMGYIPKSDTDYSPSTLYGLSKVKMEEIVRSQKELNFAWTIIRPISVWGPWFGEPYEDLFKAIHKGWYFHIGSGHYKRSMGYVENMTRQIHQLLLAPLGKVEKKTFYLGDNEPVDLGDFADEIQKQLGVRKIYHIPLWIMKALAKFGDLLQKVGWKKVPLTSFRLNNILTEYVFDLTSIEEICDFRHYDYKVGIKRTIDYMNKLRKF
jgi:nucleoside-diphosphate-sugar epimerase